MIWSDLKVTLPWRSPVLRRYRQRFGRAPTERFSPQGWREQITAGPVLHIDEIWKYYYEIIYQHNN